MRISTKLTLSLTTIGLLVFIGYGLYLLSVEQQDLTRVVSQQTQMLGKSLQIAIENALRDKQLEDIEELLKGLEQIETDLKIRVYDQQGKAFPETAHTFHTDDFLNQLQQALRKGTSDQFYYPVQNPEYISLLLPLQNEDGEKIGNLVFVRSLKEMRRDLDTTRRDLIISSVAFISITAPLCTVIGLIYIGWPMKRLINGMSRIKAGNFAPLPLKNQQDEMGVLLAAFNDMAAELENARQKLKEEAQSRSHVQTALQDADKLITIGQLSAGLAHEIGSPLQILKGRAEHLLLCSEHPDEVVRHAKILVSQTERITRIVQQLLKFTRRRPAQLTRIDLQKPIHAVLNLLEYEAHRKLVELKFQTAPNLPMVYADSDSIQQIVLNLMTNALSAIDSGGQILITIEPGVDSPDTDKNQPPKTVCVSVSDNGCGMSPDVLKHLFEPFFTTRHEQGGVGLGLAVARSLVTLHNGTIKAESSPDQGSTITITLPIEEGQHVID